jgi:hypothetical protein
MRLWIGRIARAIPIGIRVPGVGTYSGGRMQILRMVHVVGGVLAHRGEVKNRSFWTRLICSGLILAGVVCSVSSPARAQTTRDYQKDFGAISAWDLSFTVTRSGSGSFAIDKFGDEYTWSINETITGNIYLANCSSYGCTCVSNQAKTSCDGTTASINTTINDTITEPPGAVPQNIQHQGSGPYVPQFASISYDFDDDTYYLTLDTILSSGQVLYDGAVSQTGLDWGCDSGLPYPYPAGSAASARIPFPASGLTLSGSYSVQGSPCGFELPGTLDLTAGTTQVSYTLTPSSDLDLVVQIPNYSTWRPSGGRNEKEQGVDQTGLAPSVLALQISLLRKSTGMLSPVGPDKLTLSLVDVSHEKGVALNWPATGTSDPDITFESQACYVNHCFSINEGFKINDPATEEYDNPPVGLFLAQLTPHDWGGTATLHVDAEVNGETIHGHLQGTDDATGADILIPQRQPTSRIADSWKNQFGIPLDTPDSDDSEDNPQGENGIGDGLTLFEEYRGFYMGCSGNSQEPAPEGTPNWLCQHVEGDPTRKDLFVVDTIKADQAIDDFAGAADLNVHHHGLKLADVGPAGGTSYRVINFNHTDGAHAVDQHAVVIKWSKVQPSDPNVVHSQVVTTDSFVCPDGSHSCPALPKDIDHVEIAPQFKAIMAKIGATATNNRADFGWAVQHELSHAVDVYHHGDAGHQEFWSLNSTTGAVTAIFSGPNNSVVAFPIVIVPETSDFALPNPSGAAQTSDLAKLGFGKTGPKNATLNGALLPGQWVTVGNDLCGSTVLMNGRHSGDQLDFMRYTDASAYIPAGFPSIRVWIGPGSEILGATLTDQITGTGVNDPNRQINGRKRVRYGDADAADKRGNNRSMIDVNDNHSEIMRPVQKCP